VDLSGIIFVVLAVGWAGYLIPKALKHHDDLAMSRPVETFSDSVRVVGATRTRAPAVEPADAPPASAQVATRTITRDAARRAARRRRRVLAVLVVALLAVGATSFFAYTPWWSTAVPGLLIITFLVVARLTVRAQQVRHAAPVQPSTDTSADAAVEGRTPARAAAPAEVEPDLGREDTQGLSREELAEAVAAPALDEAGLWDPLPMTLPTYVNKARARRTVRTIEITGMTSSGHDAADSELARNAEEMAAAMVEVEAQINEDERKAAGA
jgi:hypothetical protein